jgi:hypothetical protein
MGTSLKRVSPSSLNSNILNLITSVILTDGPTVSVSISICESYSIVGEVDIDCAREMKERKE